MRCSRPSSCGFIEYYDKSFFEIWLDESPHGSLADRLQAAIDTALVTSEAGTRERMFDACRRLARRWGRITSPELFDDRQWVARQLAAARTQEYESARTGTSLSALVFAMHRKGLREVGA